MLPGKFASSSAGQVLFGSFAGGVTAELTGGNFWMGAVTGATVSWLNHVMHDLVEEWDQEEPVTHKGIKSPPDPDTMDKKYQVSGKKWRTIGGRKTLVNSKGEIFQWDSKKGEIEVYTKGKKHLGGFDPFNRQKQISKPVSRTPNGKDRIPKASFFDKLGNLALPTLFIESIMLHQTSTGFSDPRFSNNIQG